MTLTKKFIKLLKQPITIHLALFILTVAYVVIGALTFTFLESKLEKPHKTYVEPQLNSNITTCLGHVLPHYRDGTLTDFTVPTEIAHCFRFEKYTQDWHFESAILFTFAVVTTIGYGHVYPVTLYGRIFFILYAIIGVPLNLINLANIGAYLVEAAEWINRKLRIYWARYLARDKERAARGKKFTSTGTFFSIVFFLYILFGAYLIPLYENVGGTLAAFYFSFVTLTTIGLGDIFPQRDGVYMVISLFYIACGLALTTIALDVLQTYLKKLHFVNRDLTEDQVENADVWFGGQKMSAGELIDMCARKYGMSEPSPEEKKKMIEEQFGSVSDVTNISSVAIDNVGFDRSSPSQAPFQTVNPNSSNAQEIPLQGIEMEPIVRARRPDNLNLAPLIPEELPRWAETEPQPFPTRRPIEPTFVQAVHEAFEELKALPDYVPPATHSAVSAIHTPLTPSSEVGKTFPSVQKHEPRRFSMTQLPIDRWPREEQYTVSRRHAQATGSPISVSNNLKKAHMIPRCISAPPDLIYESIWDMRPICTDVEPKSPNWLGRLLGWILPKRGSKEDISEPKEETKLSDQKAVYSLPHPHKPRLPLTDAVAMPMEETKIDDQERFFTPEPSISKFLGHTEEPLPQQRPTEDIQPPFFPEYKHVDKTNFPTMEEQLPQEPATNIPQRRFSRLPDPPKVYVIPMRLTGKPSSGQRVRFSDQVAGDAETKAQAVKSHIDDMISELKDLHIVPVAPETAQDRAAEQRIQRKIPEFSTAKSITPDVSKTEERKPRSESRQVPVVHVDRPQSLSPSVRLQDNPPIMSESHHSSMDDLVYDLLTVDKPRRHRSELNIPLNDIDFDAAFGTW